MMLASQVCNRALDVQLFALCLRSSFLCSDAQMIERIRAVIFAELQYTASAGSLEPHCPCLHLNHCPVFHSVCRNCKQQEVRQADCITEQAQRPNGALGPGGHQ